MTASGLLLSTREFDGLAMSLGGAVRDRTGKLFLAILIAIPIAGACFCIFDGYSAKAFAFASMLTLIGIFIIGFAFVWVRTAFRDVQKQTENHQRPKYDALVAVGAMLFAIGTLIQFVALRFPDIGVIIS